MNHWIWLVSLVGILSTAVVFGTDMFFLTIGRAALRMASPSAGTEVMGFFHLFADARMPNLGRLGDLVQPCAGRGKQEWAALVLSRIAPNADSVRHSLQSPIKTN